MIGTPNHWQIGQGHWGRIGFDLTNKTMEQYVPFSPLTSDIKFEVSFFYDK